jgi:hypothetical protein
MRRDSAGDAMQDWIGRSETVEVTAGSLRYAWEALISELVRRGA